MIDLLQSRFREIVTIAPVFFQQGYVLHRRYELQQQIPDPEGFIEYMASLTGKAFEFYSCFISYSTKDQEFADRQGGKKLHEPAKNRPVQNFPEADLLHFTIQPRQPDLLDLVLTLVLLLASMISCQATGRP